jgi:hypothetical protein
MSNRPMLEGEKHMRARGIRSPDEWDAIALTFAEPVKAPPVAIRADPRPTYVLASDGGTAWLGT